MLTPLRNIAVKILKVQSVFSVTSLFIYDKIVIRISVKILRVTNRL